MPQLARIDASPGRLWYVRGAGVAAHMGYIQRVVRYAGTPSVLLVPKLQALFPSLTSSLLDLFLKSIKQSFLAKLNVSNKSGVDSCPH
jgi:hypothetical protein